MKAAEYVRGDRRQNALRLILVLVTAGCLAMTSGCSWFKKGPVEEMPGAEPAMSMATPAPTPEVSMTEPPASVQPDSPRAGDVLPFPELEVIYFDYDRYDIRPDQLQRVDFNLKYLKEHTEDKVLITGNCDERGTSEYNFNLGQKRAASVRDYLIQGGIDDKRITVLSKGEEEPVALGHTEQAWALNRRCEFQRLF